MCTGRMRLMFQTAVIAPGPVSDMFGEYHRRHRAIYVVQDVKPSTRSSRSAPDGRVP
jgi:hypothetical protein